MPIRHRLAWVAILGLLSAGPSLAAELPAIKLKANRFETGKHVFTLAESGLPEQISIKAAESELPLEQRGGTERRETSLPGIGRGNILSGPVVVEATVEGKTVAATAVKAAKASLKGGRVVCESELAAGPLTVTLDLRYAPDGSLAGEIGYGGGTVDSLALAVPILGNVDTIVPGAPVADEVMAYPAANYVIGGNEGLAWGNSADDATSVGANAFPGVLNHAYVGSGDRGFTWLCDDGEGWTADPAASTMTLYRDDTGAITWRIVLVNKPATIDKPRTIRFTLMVHPASTKPVNHRKTAWLAWPGGGRPATGSFTRKARDGAKPVSLLRADVATVMESLSDLAVLQGPAGGDAISAKQNHVDTYPIALMRYLAGTHTGNTVLLRSNAATLSSSGANPSTDRVLLGRALLFDIGLDSSSLAHRTAAAKVMAALDRFGYFADDGQTEVIPFWRSRRLVRFGQPWSASNAFESGAEDPLAKVYVTIYRRPLEGAAGYYKTLIVIANEGPAVRDSLYLLAPAQLLGGPNRMTEQAMIAKFDFSHLPDVSDWGRPGARGRNQPSLEDMEDHGAVWLFSKRDGIESYGPSLYVRSYDFRMFLATGGPEPEKRRRRSRKE